MNAISPSTLPPLESWWRCSNTKSSLRKNNTMTPKNDLSLASLQVTIFGVKFLTQWIWKCSPNNLWSKGYRVWPKTYFSNCCSLRFHSLFWNVTLCRSALYISSNTLMANYFILPVYFLISESLIFAFFLAWERVHSKILMVVHTIPVHANLI